MNVLQQDSVTIHRLRIRGSAQTGGAGLARIGGVLQRELVSARWPEAPGESWVFIRQVRAQGPLDRLGEALLSATRSALAHGDGDILMRFDSLAELLAALLEDLINGRAAAAGTGAAGRSCSSCRRHSASATCCWSTSTCSPRSVLRCHAGRC